MDAITKEIEREFESARQTARMYQREPIQTIIIFDLQGYGYTILWTLDGVVWVNVSRKPLNAAERDAYMNRFRSESPDVVVREAEDFYCRIPEDLVTPGTRIV